MKQKSMEKKTRKNRLWALALLCGLTMTAGLTSCHDDVPEEPEKPQPSVAPSKLQISGTHEVWMWTITLKENNCKLTGKCEGYTIALGSRIDSVMFERLDATFGDYERMDLRDSAVLTLGAESKLTFANSKNLRGYPIIVQGSDGKAATLRILQQDESEVAPEAIFRPAEGWQLQKSAKTLKDGSREVTVKVDKKK